MARVISRRQFVRAAGAGGLLLVAPGVASARNAGHRARGLENDANVVVRWNNAVLQGVRDSKLGPPMVSRALAIVHTAVFDAWAAYDGVAVGTRLGGALRRPARGRSLANESTAVSFADYRAAVVLLPAEQRSGFY